MYLVCMYCITNMQYKCHLKVLVLTIMITKDIDILWLHDMFTQNVIQFDFVRWMKQILMYS